METCISTRLILIAFFFFVRAIVCEQYNSIPISTCGEVEQINYEFPNCPVHEVKVNCKVVDSDKCKLKKGVRHYMNVTFTPDFGGDDIHMIAKASVNNKLYDFAGMDTDACNYMSCPISANVQQQYNFNVLVDKSKPGGTYKVRWIMSQGGVNKCCFSNWFKIV